MKRTFDQLTLSTLSSSQVHAVRHFMLLLTQRIVNPR